MDQVTDKTAEMSVNGAQDGAEAADANGPSKSALKKAAKRELVAAQKASKPGKDTRAPTQSQQQKAPSKGPNKKKIEGAALVGIDVAKETDFSEWYQQVLTKGEFLEYYDISGCYILRVSTCAIDSKLDTD